MKDNITITISLTDLLEKSNEVRSEVVKREVEKILLDLVNNNTCEPSPKPHTPADPILSCMAAVHKHTCIHNMRIADSEIERRHSKLKKAHQARLDQALPAQYKILPTKEDYHLILIQEKIRDGFYKDITANHE